MASSKLMSRNSDLKRKLSTRASTSSDFLRNDITSARGNPLSDAPIADSFFRNAYVERNSSPDQSSPSTHVNAEISLFDAFGTVSRISDVKVEPPKRTVDDVWREIMEGKKDNEQKRQQQHKEEMITLEDFLVKVGAVVEKEAETIVDVKEEGMSYAYENKSDNYSGRVMGMSSVGIGIDVGGFGNGRGKRSLSLLEPLDKVAQQRQRRMIKNRESAARSRERKQAYQVELESMALRLEEENERLLNEMAEYREKRLNQLMENVIPVTEKQRAPRVLKRIRSMQW